MSEMPSNGGHQKEESDLLLFSFRVHVYADVCKQEKLGQDNSNAADFIKKIYIPCMSILKHAQRSTCWHDTGLFHS